MEHPTDVIRAIDLVRDTEKPRVHPNGFIQLDLDSMRRLHVWDDSIPRQATATRIHDHRFTMKSEVILGTLIQVRYPVWLDSYPFTHEIWTAVYDGKESVLVDSDIRVRCEVPEAAVINRGISYEQPLYSFHETQPLGFTATIMTKLYPHDENHAPRILVPSGSRPDNSFKRDDHDAPVLWHYIDRVIARLER